MRTKGIKRIKETRDRSRKSARDWRSVEGVNDHGKKTVFKAYSRHYNLFFFLFLLKKNAKKRGDDDCRLARLVDPPLKETIGNK